jgi:hypothetical protein
MSLLVIVLSSLIRLAWAAGLEISNDEAYHWQYLRHPDWSYFDHPPMTMLLENLGVSLTGVVTPLTLRLGFVLLFAGSLRILQLWTTEHFGPRAALWAVVGLSVSHYFTAFCVIAHPDGPLLFFSLLTFWQSARALQSGRFAHWLWVGLGFGGALLSKYHGILLPAGVVLYLLLTPGTRKVFWSPGPYFAVVIGLAAFTPVVIWNSQHEWASFRFQGGRSSQVRVPIFHEGPVRWFFGPIMYLTPWIWFWLMVVLIPRLWRFRTLTGVERLLICQSGTILLFFFLNACFQSRVLFHWALLGFVPLYPLLGARWAKLELDRPKLFRVFALFWIAAELSIVSVILLQSHTGIIPLPRSIKDPTADLSGWKSVREELDRRGFLADPEVFFFSPLWDEAAQLSFVLQASHDVACFHSFDARGFPIWSRPQDYLGRTGYLVLVDENPSPRAEEEYASFFEQFQLVAEFPMTRGGRAFRTVRVYLGTKMIREYPFDYTSRVPRGRS